MNNIFKITVLLISLVTAQDLVSKEKLLEEKQALLA